jgi:hypothetical protein
MLLPIAKSPLRRCDWKQFSHGVAARDFNFITVHTFGGRGSPS